MFALRLNEDWISLTIQEEILFTSLNVPHAASQGRRQYYLLKYRTSPILFFCVHKINREIHVGDMRLSARMCVTTKDDLWIFHIKVRVYYDDDDDDYPRVQA